MGLIVVSLWWAQLSGGLAASSDEPGSALPSDQLQPPDSQSTVSPPTPPMPPALPSTPVPGVSPGLPQSGANPAAAPVIRSPFGPAPGVFPDTGAPSVTAPAQQTGPFGPQPGVFPGLAPKPPAQTPPRAATPLPAGEASQTGAPTTPSPPEAEIPAAAPAPVPLQPQYGLGLPVPGFGGPVPLLEPAPGFLPAQAPPAITAIPAPEPGAIPIQANDLRAPPILIRSNIGLAAAYTDNPGNTPQTFSDLILHPSGGITASFDTVRLQGQLSGSLDYQKYARDKQFDALNANLLAFGLGTIVRDQVFIDGRAALIPLSSTGGFGFASPNLIPASQQTQAFLLSTTPIVRESIGDLLVGEFRYNYTLSSFLSGGFLGNSATPAANAATPSSTTQNEATLTLAAGPRFGVLGSKVTVDYTEIASSGNTNIGSLADSKQFRAYDDVQYRINQKLSALGRIGYDNLRYPQSPLSDFAGPSWSIGARYAPSLSSYVEIRYGRQDGINGVSGNLLYQITAATSVMASLQNSRTTSQQQLITNLNLAQLGPNGVLVNRLTGVPISLTNLEVPFPIAAVYEDQYATLGIVSNIGRNTLTALAFLDDRTPLGTGSTTVSTLANGAGTWWGVNLNWSRSLRPNLTGYVSLGYAGQDTSQTKTLNADALLAYAMSERLSATLHYQFINSESHTVNSSYRRNQVEIGLRRYF
jgi:uncharacterized protein (PEP-CTERM system associated)